MKNKKMKQLLATIMIAITIAATVPTINPTTAFASDVTYATEAEAAAAGFSFILSNNEYKIILYHGSGAVTIPSQINGKSVTSIGDSAFNGCFRLRLITIPDSVTSIGDSAFEYCSGLTSITIPNGVTSISNSAFYGCSGLTSITIPDSVTSIGDSAFYGCSGLTSITIPNGVTSIGYQTFYGCSSLTSITIPDSVTSIGDSAFYGCSGLTSITIPGGVTSIGNSAFKYCSGLTSITIPDGVTSISDGAFEYCSGLTSITIPDSVTSIGNGAFHACIGLTSITIQNGVTSIGNDAFASCNGLKSITIPNSVISIGDYAFSCCGSLTSITIPDSVTSIGDDAFQFIHNAIFYVPNLTIAGYVNPYVNYVILQVALTLVSKNATTATLSFPAQIGATSVKMQQSTDGGMTWMDATTETLTESSTSATVTRLQPNTNYKFRLFINDKFSGSSFDVATDPTTLAYTVAAAAASSLPIAGADNAVTLTVKDSTGSTDTTFTGTKAVTVSGYTAAPYGNYGSFNGTTLTGALNTTINVDFTNGVATPNLVLNNAAAQDVVISIAGVNTPLANTVTIAPVPATASSMQLTQDIIAPTANGGQFEQQPKVTLKDTYGNISVNNNSTQVTAAKNDGGTWNLTGTTTETVSGGVASFSDLGATNGAAVTGAQLAFSSTGFTQITSGIVNLPEPAQVPVAPSITNQPTTQTKTEGETVSFSVVATGDAPLIYQWKKDGVDLVGKTSFILTLNNVQKSDEGSYKVLVTNSAGSITSNEAILTVTTPAAVTYTLNYTGEAGGTIEGNSSQTVDEGNDGTTVTAVANTGYHFVSWSDGKTNASRKDTDVNEDINVSAKFELDLPGNTDTTPAAIKIIGTEKVDNTLEAQLIDENGVSVTTSSAVTYKWYRMPSSDSENGTPIGEGSTYKLVSADIGNYIKLVVFYVDETFEYITSTILGNSSGHKGSRHSSKTGSSSSTEQITVNVTDGTSDTAISKTVIERKTASDGTKTDTVTYTADKAKETIAALVSAGKDTARIVAADSDASVAETKINIPSDTLAALSSGNVNLEIQTNRAIVSIPKDTIQGLSQSGELNGDLYFRLVPINDQAKQTEIKTTADKQAVIRVVSGNNGVQVLGTPITIETNMSQGTVDILLSLEGISIPTDEAQRQAFLNDLGVFIKHSDGEKVLEKGQVVEYAAGVFGIKFTVTKFSDFTIVKLNQNIQTSWKKTNGDWYFFNNDGTIITGWYKSESGDWFHLGTDGKMDIGWFKDTDGSWYFLCDGKDSGTLGVMEIGWKFTDGKWYFLKDNGAMATGWTYVDSN